MGGHETICLQTNDEYLYELPKIHKVITLLKPILSMIGPAQRNIAKGLTDILEPAVQLHSQRCISDSFIFVH